MPTLLFQFPGGRYHATPWGHHVNEGLVEWPPSPWRLLRALISTGYTTLGWPEVPDAGRRLIETLASVDPHYRLPTASLAQSRHYMPLGTLDKGREKTTLVYDTWARVEDGTLAVTWPVTLDPEAGELLSLLARQIGYLGRAESRVEATPAEDTLPWHDNELSRPVSTYTPSSPGWEQIALLAPAPPGDYADWRAQALESALTPYPLPGDGKKPSARLKKERERVEAIYPADLLACLQAQSGWMQKVGWSQPPGSRRVLYWRRASSLEVGPPRVRRDRPRNPTAEAVLLALATPTGNLHALPARVRTLPQAELLHRSLVSQLNRLGRQEEAPELIGKNPEGRPLTGHRHAHILPLDLDGDAHLEHILIWCPGGLSDAAQESIRAVRRTFMKGGVGDLRVAVAAIGSRTELLQLPTRYGRCMSAVFAPAGGARTWESLTPFVPPRYLKPRGSNSLEGQVRAELESRGLPAARIEVLSAHRADVIQARHFVRQRRFGAPAPQDVGFNLRLTFDDGIQGPVCLGYASHFGLGCFQISSEI